MADDGFDFHENGTVTATIDGTAYKLRRPKAGEFFDFLEAIEETNDASRAEALAITDDRKEAGEDLDASTLGALRKRERDLSRRMTEGRRAIVRSMIEALCDKALPTDDDLPVWLMQDRTITELLKHWQEVPIRRGGS